MALRRIIHADLDAFFVSVEQVLDPTLKGKPVIVGVALSGFVPVARQLDMLDGKAERLEELNRAIDRIRAR